MGESNPVAGRADWPAKPAKMGLNAAFVSVVDVCGGTGVPADERAWTMLIEDHQFERPVELFVGAAELWWSDTDQSGECMVRLRIEGGDRSVIERWVRISVEVSARVVAHGPVSVQGESGGVQ